MGEMFRSSDLAQNKILPDMRENIKCGNSLIGSDFYADKNFLDFCMEEQRKVNAFDWEKEFPQLKPKKGARGTRQYTKEDIEVVRVIYNLVKVRGLRIDAARELMKHNREGVEQKTEVVDRLRAIRQELTVLKKALGDMV